MGRKVNRKHFVVEGPVECLPARQRRRRSRVSARRYMKYFFPVGYSNSAKCFVASRYVSHTVGDARRAMHRTGSPELPDQRAVRNGYAIEMLIVRADQHSVA